MSPPAITRVKLGSSKGFDWAAVAKIQRGLLFVRTRARGLLDLRSQACPESASRGRNGDFGIDSRRTP